LWGFGKPLKRIIDENGENFSVERENIEKKNAKF